MYKYKLSHQVPNLLLVGIVVMVIAMVSITATNAADSIINDQGSCESVDGTWDEPSKTCTFSTNYEIESGDKLTIATGVTLVINARLEIEGSLENNGTLVQNAQVEIEGLLENNNAIIASDGLLVNKSSGTLRNKGIMYFGANALLENNINLIENEGTIVNEKEIINNGTIDNKCMGTITGTVGPNQPINNPGSAECSNDVDIAINKTPDVQAIQLGETANFTVTITNTGNVALGNIVVTDALVPDCNFTMTSLTPGSGSSQSCSKSNVTEGFTNTVVVNADNPDGLLLPGMTATLDFIVEQKEDVLMAPNAATRIQPTASMMEAMFKNMQKQFVRHDARACKR